MRPVRARLGVVLVALLFSLAVASAVVGITGAPRPANLVGWTIVNAKTGAVVTSTCPDTSGRCSLTKGRGPRCGTVTINAATGAVSRVRTETCGPPP